MGYDCAIHVEGLTRQDFGEFLERLERVGVLDAVDPISFTDAEKVTIVGYDDTEFVARYGAFAGDREERLWVLFEFGSASDASKLAGAEGFELLSEKLPRLERLRSEIESVTGRETGAGIYRSRKIAYDR